MKREDWYDAEGGSSPGSVSEKVQRFAAASQFFIQAAIEAFNPGNSFRVVSGWRDVATNRRVGGVSDSLHLVGLARDFRNDSCDEPPVVPSFLQVLPSGPDGLTYHVQFRVCSVRRDFIFRKLGFR